MRKASAFGALIGAIVLAITLSVGSRAEYAAPAAPVSITNMTPMPNGGGVNAAFSSGSVVNLAASALISAMGLGTASLQDVSAFYAASNPSGFITSAQIPVQSVCGQTGAISNVSSCSGIPSYTLPPATSSALGGVKVSSGLSVSGDGTLTALVQSIAGLTGAVTVAALQIALGLGTAAYTASSSYDAAGSASSAVAAIPSPCTTGSKIACGTATTAASTGVWSATLSPTCSSTPLTVQAVAKAASTSLSSSVNTSITSISATTVAGIATSPATLTILGLTVIAPPTATPVYVMAVCP